MQTRLYVKFRESMAAASTSGLPNAKFTFKGMSLTNHFHMDCWATEYNFVADSFHTKKLCSRLSSSEV